MTEHGNQRLAILFDRALGRAPGAQREQFLSDACGDDAGLLAELRSLLAAHERAGGFLATAPHVAVHALLGEQLLQSMVGRCFGSWCIERPIYAGGMGAVYLVRREGGDFEQRAALKIIGAGIVRTDAVERFAQERQVLARLEHPYIARLLDGGTTEGMPWLVMEYIAGEPIDLWADAQALDLHERLVLFEQVCEAVQYAHRHLVVHRDIKPDNILVTADGTPKLLDFGIAKLLPPGGLPPDKTATQLRSFTPGYASPEQFSGQPVTTAADVYSLGALLYRLLTGCLPFMVEGAASLTRIERLVFERAPELPSVVVSRVAGAPLPRVGQWRAPQLQRALKGDLDTIIMTALRKEPERRFESVAALAEDLRRHRQGLPVSARPDTLGYRVRKFTGRHWKSVMVAGLAVAALCAGLVFALWQAGQARAERDRAQRINIFLQDILVEADPYEAGAEATVRDVLRKADDMIAERFAGEPDLEAALRYTIGYTQLSLMAVDEAQRNLARADELNLALYGSGDARSLRSRVQLASLAYERGDVQDSIVGYREVIGRLTPNHPSDLRATAFNDFGIVLLNSDREREALEYLALALAEVSGRDDAQEDIANIHNNIGHAHHNLGELDEAERNYRRALGLMRALHPDGHHPDAASAVNNLGVLLYDLGRREEALPLYVESLEIRRAVLGDTHPRTGMGHLNLGKLLMESGRTGDAGPHLRTALILARDGLGDTHSQTLLTRAALARLAFLEGESSRAALELEAVREALVGIEAPASRVADVVRWRDEARHRASMPLSAAD